MTFSFKFAIEDYHTLILGFARWFRSVASALTVVEYSSSSVANSGP